MNFIWLAKKVLGWKYLFDTFITKQSFLMDGHQQWEFQLQPAVGNNDLSSLCKNSEENLRSKYWPRPSLKIQLNMKRLVSLCILLKRLNLFTIIIDNHHSCNTLEAKISSFMVCNLIWLYQQECSSSVMYTLWACILFIVSSKSVACNFLRKDYLVISSWFER